jgi:hypothetical protein
MLKKTLMVATLGTALAAGTLSTTASAQGDPFVGALVGGGIGAAIGHSVNGHNGAWVGGAVGALAGASIAANSGYYGGYLRPAIRGARRITLRQHLLLRTVARVRRAAGGCLSGRGRSSTRAPITTGRVLRHRPRATGTYRTILDPLSSSSTHVRPRDQAGLFFCAHAPAEESG